MLKNIQGIDLKKNCRCKGAVGVWSVVGHGQGTCRSHIRDSFRGDQATRCAAPFHAYIYMMMYVQIVSDDGKKVRRRQPFTEKHKEELQVGQSSRLVLIAF